MQIKLILNFLCKCLHRVLQVANNRRPVLLDTSINSQYDFTKFENDFYTNICNYVYAQLLKKIKKNKTSLCLQNVFESLTSRILNLKLFNFLHRFQS